MQKNYNRQMAKSGKIDYSHIHLFFWKFPSSSIIHRKVANPYHKSIVLIKIWHFVRGAMWKKRAIHKIYPALQYFFFHSYLPLFFLFFFFNISPRDMGCNLSCGGEAAISVSALDSFRHAQISDLTPAALGDI